MLTLNSAWQTGAYFLIIDVFASKEQKECELRNARASSMS